MALALQRVYRRMRYGEPVVVVSGLPRSGTSMAMKMLAAGGLAVLSDGVREADVDNPKGYFELEAVKELARSPDKEWLREARGKVVKIISHLLKELPPDNNYRVLFMHRQIEEVLASQHKMLTRRNEASDTPDQRMTELFADDVWRARYTLRHRPWFESLELHYAEVVEDPLTHARRVNEFLGGRLDVERMVSVVDPDLYRNRAG
jgi:Sulfotransferase domain